MERLKEVQRFERGIISRELTIFENEGGGNCVFMSLAQILLGDANHFHIIRSMILKRMRRFPHKYAGNKKNFSNYCRDMAQDGQPASVLELQVIADICFATVECYSTADFNTPTQIIRPLRSDKTR